jgi:preprotein translocase subunit SecG
MYTFIIVLIIIVSLLLALIVLVQNSKGGGLASGFSASNQVMGVRKTTDLLEKLTWGFGLSLIVLAIVANFVLPKGQGTGGSGSVLQEQIDNLPAPQQAPATAPAPAGNTAQPAAAPDSAR